MYDFYYVIYFWSENARKLLTFHYVMKAQAHVQAHAQVQKALPPPPAVVPSSVAVHHTSHLQGPSRETALAEICQQQEDALEAMEMALTTTTQERDLARKEAEKAQKEISQLFGHAQGIVESDIAATEEAIGDAAAASAVKQNDRDAKIAAGRSLHDPAVGLSLVDRRAVCLVCAL